MYLAEHGPFAWYKSEDFRQYPVPPQDPTWPERWLALQEQMWFRRKMFAELFEVWSQRYGLQGYKLLEAHGGVNKSAWYYYEQGAPVAKVQNWIDDSDGTAAALLVLSCNTNNGELSSRRSLLLHLARIPHHIVEQTHNTTLLRLYAPGIGYLERDYNKTRRLINHLKSADRPARHF